MCSAHGKRPLPSIRSATNGKRWATTMLGKLWSLPEASMEGDSFGWSENPWPSGVVETKINKQTCEFLPWSFELKYVSNWPMIWESFFWGAGRLVPTTVIGRLKQQVMGSTFEVHLVHLDFKRSGNDHLALLKWCTVCMSKIVHPKMDDESIDTALMRPKVSQPVDVWFEACWKHEDFNVHTIDALLLKSSSTTKKDPFPSESPLNYYWTTIEQQMILGLYPQTPISIYHHLPSSIIFQVSAFQGVDSTSMDRWLLQVLPSNAAQGPRSSPFEAHGTDGGVGKYWFLEDG